YLGGASVTEEFTDRWRVPGATTSRQWEERFGEIKYIPLGEHAWNAALKNAQLAPGDVSIAVVTGPHARAVRGLAGRLGAMVAVEPPRRPEPARTSSSAAARSEDWKFGFVGSRDRKSGLVYMPPARISAKNDSVDDMDAVPMADVLGTVVTYTVDRLAYSPS